MKVKIQCDRCKGTGKVRFKHIADGVCFQCEGVGTIEVNPSSIKTEEQKEKKYIHFYEGKIELLTSEKLPTPKYKTNRYVPEQFEIEGITVYYRKEYNTMTKISALYSAVYEYTENEVSTHILSRLLKCYIKENDLALWEAFNDVKMIEETKEKMNNSYSLAVKLLEGMGI